MSLWAVHHVKVTVDQSSFLFSRSQHYIIQWRHQWLVWFSREVTSADYHLSQSAEMIPWAVHHVEVVITCQTDSGLVIVSVQP